MRQSRADCPDGGLASAVLSRVPSVANDGGGVCRAVVRAYAPAPLHALYLPRLAQLSVRALRSSSRSHAAATSSNFRRARCRGIGTAVWFRVT